MKKPLITSLFFALATFLLLSASLLGWQVIEAQNVAITDDNSYTAHPSAMLDVKSTTKGMLIPRMTTVQRLAVSNPAAGLLVFDINDYAFYYYNGLQWTSLSTGSGNIWQKTGSNVYLSNSADHVGIGTAAPVGKLGVLGDVPVDSEEPLFEVVNSNGDTVFAVYSQGVRINVADDPAVKAGGNKAGFAVGGFSLSKGITNDYLVVTPDSVRIYIEDTTSAKAGPNKAGFAVGGFSLSKGTVTDDFLYVAPEKTRVYVKDSTEGFAVASIQGGPESNFLNLTTQNYFIGHESGLNNSGGDYNSFFGYKTGYDLTTGDRNVFIGYKSGYATQNGTDNLFFGYCSGYKNIGGDDNIFIGNRSGYDNTEGSDNIFVGYRSGYNNETGGQNLFVGNRSGYYNEDGSENMFLGYYSGYSNNSGSGNMFLGYYTGYSNTTGVRNFFAGYRAGFNNIDGYSNVFIGDSCGVLNTSGRQNIFIGNKAGYNNSTGEYNVLIGYRAGIMANSVSNTCVGTLTGENLTAGYGNTLVGSLSGRDVGNGTNNTYIGCSAGGWHIGSENTFVGAYAGSGNQNGSGNVFIGYGAGLYETGSEKLYIDNSSTTSPLIWGDFSTSEVEIDGSLHVDDEFYDSSMDPGSSGQILSSTGTGTNWISAPTADITGVTAGDGLTGGGTSGDVTLHVGAGDGIDIYSDYLAVDVTDLAGYGLTEDASNNLQVGAGDGIDVASSSVSVDVTDILGNGTREDGNNIEVFALQASDGFPDNVVYVDASGNVGVGTTSPGEQLHVNGGVRIGNTSNSAYGNLRWTGSDIEGYSSGGWKSLTQQGDITGVTAGNGLSGGGTAGDVTLHVSVGDGISNSGDQVSVVVNDLLGTGMRNDGSNNFQCYALQASDGSPANCVYTTADGKVAINSTLAYTTLDVNGGFRVQSYAWPTAGAGLEMAWDGNLSYIQSYSRATSSWKGLMLGGNVGPVSDNSFTMGTASNRWTYIYAVNGTIQTSDRRQKKNIKDIEYGLPEIMRLRPVSFNWKENDTGTRLGLIAQDVQKIIKEVVVEGDDENKTLGLNYEELVPVLIKAIQEQQAEIEQLKKANESSQAEIKRINTVLQSSTKK